MDWIGSWEIYYREHLLLGILGNFIALAQMNSNYSVVLSLNIRHDKCFPVLESFTLTSGSRMRGCTDEPIDVESL
jgi:hypothetical protein